MIVVQQPPQRRKIEMDGITYEEILPGDELTWKEVVVGVAVFVFVIMPIVAAILRWVLFPIFSFIFDGRWSWSW